MKNFKSYGFWTALAGAVVVLLNAIGKCFGFAVEEQIVTDIIMAIAGVLVVFGVVSMPKKANSQNQEKTEEKETQEKQEDESLMTEEKTSKEEKDDPKEEE